MKNRVQEIRWKKGWSQQQLANRSGVRKSTISALENQKIQHPSFEIVHQLAKALGVDASELFYDDK